MRSRTMANRSALLLAGLALLAAGTAFGQRGDDKVLTVALRHLEHPDHRLLLAAGSAGLATSLLLLTTQIPHPARGRLWLAAPGCQVDSGAIRRAVQLSCAAVPGVVRARCRLTGRRQTMRLAITITMNGTAHPGDVLTTVADGVHMQIAPLLTPRRIHTHIRLRVHRPRPRRAL